MIDLKWLIMVHYAYVEFRGFCQQHVTVKYVLVYCGVLSFILHTEFAKFVNTCI